MKINVLYEFLHYITRKDPIGNTLSPEEFNNLLPVAVWKYFKKIFGLPEEYEKGMERARLGFGLNATLEKKISVLKDTSPTLVIDDDGLADYPGDFFRYGAIVINDGANQEIDIPVLNDQQFGERKSSFIDFPTDEDPICRMLATQFEFFPGELDYVHARYIKYPTDPVMGYVIDDSTAETVYVEKGAYYQITGGVSVGQSVNLVANAVLIGTYTAVPGDTVSDVMEKSAVAINVNTLSHHVKAVYDGEKVVLIDQNNLYTTLTVGVAAITYIKTNFSVWSTQCDWEDDIESMNDIAEIMIDMIGISIREVNIIQWADKERATA